MMARRRSKTLNERQKKILDVLERFQINYGRPPSIREICKQTNITSTSVVNYYLEQLKELGLIERDEHVSRGIRLVKPLTNLFRIPKLGNIAAGEPIPLPPSDFSYFDEVDSWVEVASSLMPSREKADELFALEVKGDSMIDAMIYDGDIVILKPAVEARNGEMVAIWLKDRDETTLKYFYKEGKRVRLQPANPRIDPIYIDDPSIVQVQGKVVMVIRQLEGMTV